MKATQLQSDLMALRAAEISLAELDGMQAGYHDFRFALIRPKTMCPHKWEVDQALVIAWETGWITGAKAAQRFGDVIGSKIGANVSAMNA